MLKIFKKNKILSISLLSLLLGVSIAHNVSYAVTDTNLELKSTPTPAQETAIKQAAGAEANKIVKMDCPFGSTAVYDKSLAVKYNISPSTIISMLTPFGALWNPPVSLTIVENPKSCIRQASSKADCDIKTGEQPYLSQQNPDVWICYVAPTETVRASDLANAKITQGVRPYKMQVPIPCEPLAGGQCPDIQGGVSLAAYITRLYQFGLMIVGLFAFGGIIYGAFKYILSAGSMADQSDAKDQITQAIVGLVLLLGAYTLLYTINPRLVSLRDPELVPLNVSNLTAVESDAGETSQISKTGSGSVDSLCKYNLNVGIDVRFNSSLGTIGGPQSGSTCVSCLENASKVDGVCKCDSGYSKLRGAAYSSCVPQKEALQLQLDCSAKAEYIWNDGECIKA